MDIDVYDNKIRVTRGNVFTLLSLSLTKIKSLAPSKTENKCAEKEERRKGGGRKYHDERNTEFIESRHVTIVKSCFGGSLAFRVRILEKAQVQCEEEGVFLPGSGGGAIILRNFHARPASPLLSLSLSSSNSRSLEESAHVTLIMREDPPRRNVQPVLKGFKVRPHDFVNVNAIGMAPPQGRDLGRDSSSKLAKFSHNF